MLLMFLFFTTATLCNFAVQTTLQLQLSSATYTHTDDDDDDDNDDIVIITNQWCNNLDETY